MEGIRQKSRSKKETYEDMLQEVHEKTKAIPVEHRKPNVCGFRELFVEHLDSIASEANSQRFKDDHISSDLNWELKAKNRLFGEAKDLVLTATFVLMD